MGEEGGLQWWVAVTTLRVALGPYVGKILSARARKMIFFPDLSFPTSHFSAGSLEVQTSKNSRKLDANNSNQLLPDLGGKKEKI